MMVIVSLKQEHTESIPPRAILSCLTEFFVNNITYVLIYLGFPLIFVNFALSSKIFRRVLQ